MRPSDEFRFKTEIRAPGVFTGFIGAGMGINAPANAPAGPGGGPGLPVIPPAITALDGAGSAGLKSYTIAVVRGTGAGATRTPLGGEKSLFAVPSNVGPRTMPDYDTLARQGIYTVSQNLPAQLVATEGNVKVFAGTVDDPFYIDLGASFDSLNLRPQAFGSGVAGVLTPIEDLDDQSKRAFDTVAGYNVNAIAIEVPITLVTAAGSRVPSTDRRATIGAWATTSRQATTRRSAEPSQGEGIPAGAAHGESANQ